MPTQHITTSYSFDELSEEAQQNAIDNTRNSEGYLDHEWWDFTYEDFKECLAILGFDVDLKQTYFSGFCSQGDGAAFTAEYEYKKGWKAALKSQNGKEDLEKLLDIGERLQEEQKKSFYKLTAKTEPWDHRTYSQRTEVQHYDHEYDGITSEQEEAICDICNELGGWLYKRLEAENDYLMGDEAIKEAIQSNDW